METLYAWLLVSGGATLVLFGVSVFASDRRLGKQRRQANELGRKQFSAAQCAEMDSRAGSMPSHNRALEKSASVSVPHDSGDPIRELQEKIVNLRKQLHTNETRLSESSRELERLGQRNVGLQAEVANLKQQLQANQKKIQQFESVKQRLVDRLQKTESIATGSERKDAVDCEPGRGSELALKSRIAQLTIKNNELLAEIDSLSRKHATRQPSRSPVSSLQRLVRLGTRKPAEGKEPFGIVSAAASVAIVAALAIGFARTGANKLPAEMPHTSKPASGESRLAILEAPTEPSLTDAPPEPAPHNREKSKQENSKPTPPTIKPTPVLTGTFEITRATEVFNGPTESSALIGTLTAGAKIHVVNSRDGWLEVRSKHGTAGFVRQDAAVRSAP